MKRVAVFQYGWPLQSHTGSLVGALASSGCEVDLYMQHCEPELIDLEKLRSLPNIRVFRRGGKLSLLYRLAMQRISIPATLLPAVRAIRNHNYDCLIGIEKMGMTQAGMLSKRSGVPFVYYSLELYDEEHPFFRDQPGFAILRKAEKRFHQKALATIVQDPQRGAHLLRANEVSNPLIYLPVSVPGPPIRTRSRYFRERFSIPDHLPIVLYLGAIDEGRRCVEVARVAATNKDRFAFVFHGYGESRVLEKIRDSVTLSTDLVPEAELPDIISSADIGLALYRDDCANDRLTAFSSEKVALYCKAGIPFIAFDTESYRALMAEVECGALVGDADEVPAAIAKILADSERFRANAHAAFERFYRYDVNAGRAFADLSRLLYSHDPGDRGDQTRRPSARPDHPERLP